MKRRILFLGTVRELIAPKLVVVIPMVCFAHPSHAVTLERVLQVTLEKNPGHRASEIRP